MDGLTTRLAWFKAVILPMRGLCARVCAARARPASTSTT